MHKRLTYANVAATLALVLAMSGGALAASHYLINSTKQINPKVLKKLKGATGRPARKAQPAKKARRGEKARRAKKALVDPATCGTWATGTRPNHAPADAVLPAGTYLVSAKTTVTGGKGDAVCVLSGGSAADRTYSATSESITQVTMSNLETDGSKSRRARRTGMQTVRPDRPSGMRI